MLLLTRTDMSHQAAPPFGSRIMSPSRRRVLQVAHADVFPSGGAYCRWLALNASHPGGAYYWWLALICPLQAARTSYYGTPRPWSWETGHCQDRAARVPTGSSLLLCPHQTARTAGGSLLLCPIGGGAYWVARTVLIPIRRRVLVISPV
ncbi:hypothetical protein AVEN_119263-1 [Araneus ventricosus]|uniref:Uncharacterized protein n=1 Tax=Araneus ventricosus TaxID=182803 RepID=A0A4Y2T232_ARAVE|nr:hypothetical protein AVEN_119263-1 [Araneus ventricosus]